MSKDCIEDSESILLNSEGRKVSSRQSPSSDEYLSRMSKEDIFMNLNLKIGGIREGLWILY